MIDQFYLHIGIQKTGTSSIQEYLLRNRNILLEHGVLYPLTGLQINSHVELAWSVNTFEIQQRNLTIDVDDLWSRLHAEISASDADKAVVSSEDFSLLQNPSAIGNRLKNYDPWIVCYIRRQDEWLESFYNHNVKDYPSRYRAPIKTLIETNHLYEKLDYHNDVKKWADVFGRERIILRRYGRKYFLNNLIDDFCAICGIQKDWNLAPSERDENPSLDYPALMIIRALNSINLDFDVHDSIVQKLYALSRTIGKRSLYSKHHILDYESRREIMDYFQSSNDAVCREYFPESSELFENPERQDDTVEVEGLMEQYLSALREDPAIAPLLEKAGPFRI